MLIKLHWLMLIKLRQQRQHVVRQSVALRGEAGPQRLAHALIGQGQGDVDDSGTAAVLSRCRSAKRFALHFHERQNGHVSQKFLDFVAFGRDIAVNKETEA